MSSSRCTNPVSSYPEKTSLTQKVYSIHSVHYKTRKRAFCTTLERRLPMPKLGRQMATIRTLDETIDAKTPLSCAVSDNHSNSWYIDITMVTKIGIC